MDAFFTPENLVALLSLTALELVLGIDNIVFIAILAARVRRDKQAITYRLGLSAALITRLGLLFTISWVMRLDEALFTLPDFFINVLPHGRGETYSPEITARVLGISGRDLILLGGGLFLIFKSTHEIYSKLEGHDHEGTVKGSASVVGTVIQIMFIDIVFSLDSVITAVGMVDHVPVMVVAMVIAVGAMLLFARSVGDFVNRHPSMKVLALSFLLLIGVLLSAESLEQHVNKGYIYFAMAFSLLVEVLNMRLRKKQQPIRLHDSEPLDPGQVPRESSFPGPTNANDSGV